MKFLVYNTKSVKLRILASKVEYVKAYVFGKDCLHAEISGHMFRLKTSGGKDVEVAQLLAEKLVEAFTEMLVSPYIEDITLVCKYCCQKLGIELDEIAYKGITSNSKLGG